MRYLKLVYLFGRRSLMDQMAYRGTFFLAVFGKVSRMIIPFIFFQAIFLKVSRVGGWSYQEISVLIATYLTLESLAIITFHRNLAFYLPDSLRKGEFDFLLTKPVNTLFFASFKIIDFFDLTSALTAVGAWIYVFKILNVHVNLFNFVPFFIACLIALGFWYSLILCLASTSFWTITATGLGRFLEGIIRTSRYPATIFQGPWHNIVFYIFPLAFMSTLPAGILLEKITSTYLFYALLFTAIAIFSSLKFWKYALRHYQSAA